MTVPRLCLLLLAAALRASSGAAGHAHPCAYAAAGQAGRAFASACHGPHGASAAGAAPHSASLYVCLPLDVAAAAETPPRRGLDPLTRAHGPDAFVGRLYRAGWPAGVFAYALEFEDLATVVAAGNGSAASSLHSCTMGAAAGLEPGDYTAAVVHEYSGWGWDPEWTPHEPGTAGPSFGTAAGGSAALIGTAALPLLEWTLTVHGSALLSPLLRTALQPECTTHALTGTFAVAAAAGAGAARAFRPSHCARREVSYDQFDGCMARLGGRVAVQGDSNARRAMKLLMTRGAWCGAPGAAGEHYCRCEDQGGFPVEGEPGVGRDWMAVAQAGIRYANASLLDFEPFGGFIPSAYYYSAWEGKPPAKVAVVASLGAWPEAEANVTEFVARLAGVVDALLSLPASTRLVFRSAPYFCCRAGAFHRFSEKRQRLFTRLYRAAVLGAFPGRAYWWDTRSLSEPRPLDEIAPHAEYCPSNHLPSELVVEDVKTLMHLLCVIAD